MENKVISDSYCEALAYVIITQAQFLEDKVKAGAFISLFLQSINKKYGEAGLKQVVEEIKKELSPQSPQKPGYKQTVRKGADTRPRKQSPFMRRLRNKLSKKKQQQARTQ
ncbi:hypothetical protein [Candidatus Magnetominusculus dajiuhuensis]|uniref:hypothetical protein n=1 Tax=Candidatus Magnetominusculus dajiuhuensis TaxID=3137712 RepID=UPI003B43887F